MVGSPPTMSSPHCDWGWGKKWLEEARRLTVSRDRKAGGVLEGNCSDTSAHPLTLVLSPPLHLAQGLPVFASMSPAKNSSPDVEALGKINRKGIKRLGETFPFFGPGIVAPYTLELTMLERGVRKNFPVTLVPLGSRAEDLC